MECELINKLNEATENVYNFSLKSATLKKDADFCVLEIYYKDGTVLNQAKKDEILNIMFDIIPQNFKYEVKFIKNYISEESLADELKIFMKKTCPSVVFRVGEIQVEGNKFLATILVDNISIDYAKNLKLEVKASEYFKSKYSNYEFCFNLSESKILSGTTNQSVKLNIQEEEQDDEMPHRKIEVTDKEVYIGDEIDESACYIKDKEKLEGLVCFCGNIKQIKSFVITSKPKKKEDKTDENKKSSAEVADESEDDEKGVRERKIFKWTLSGFTGELTCSYMSTKATRAKMEVLENDKSVIVRGNLITNKRDGELMLDIKDISFCKLPENFEEFIIYKKEKPYYEFVKPEKVVTYKQNDLLSFMQEEKVCPYLAGKTFVCYDLETTGLSFTGGDKIIEIGAVKIENGKITEQFATLVNPERSISASASKVNQIYDADVVDAPTTSQALQDFYKFTRGAILIGYNSINFDNIFLFGLGKECRYNFDNKCEDVYPIAQKYVRNVKNYKLITIAEKLGVTLDNAHRALFDTLATAEVFIKLAENLS